MATLYGGQYGGIVIVIRPQWPGLEGLNEKNGNFLPFFKIGWRQSQKAASAYL